MMISKFRMSWTPEGSDKEELLGTPDECKEALMAKKVRLTWNDGENEIVETCLLIDENDPIYTKDGKQLVGLNHMLADTGRVIFEDEDGIFGVFPYQIVNIEVL